jgi:hypothetical protein
MMYLYLWLKSRIELLFCLLNKEAISAADEVTKPSLEIVASFLGFSLSRATVKREWRKSRTKLLSKLQTLLSSVYNFQSLWINLWTSVTLHNATFS